jgi:hypothetical protein
VTGSKKKEGRIIGNTTIPSIRPGDAGAKRRLLKEMDKRMDWTPGPMIN